MSLRLDLLQPDQWFELNEQLKAALNVEGTQQIKVFKGMAHGLYESVQGLAQLLSHKRTFAYVNGGSPWIQGLIPLLVRDGFKALPLETDTLSQAIQDNADDLCFLILPQDHAVTGELYDWSSITDLLNRKRVFSIHLCHHSFWLSRKVNGFEGYLGGLRSDLSIFQSGQRWKISSLVAKDMQWNRAQVLGEILDLKNNFQEAEASVLNFESNLPPGFEPYFDLKKRRVFDRAVIVNRNVSAEALMSHLQERMQIPTVVPGQMGLIETPNLCRWGGSGLYDSWWVPTQSSELIRGMLILDMALLEKPTICQDLEWAANQCQV